jgi:hypothetical protein
VAAMREETIAKMHSIVAKDDNPLTIIVAMVLNPELDVQVRLGAASICLPYLFPRLSASTVDARVVQVRVDSAEVLARLSAQIERLALPAAPEPAQAAEDVAA